MPNQIDQNGLQVSSLSEILSSLITSFNNIYGANINLDQNTPDAQLLNIFAQILVSYGELLQDINASFDPDQAVGVVLDQRVKYNGIVRKEGYKTLCDVTVTFNGSATLKGQDLYPLEECFTISDGSGNTLVPVLTTTGVNGDVKTVQFIATEYGALNFTAGTVTKIDTPIAGVDSVSNLDTVPENVGSDEESDAQLRVRRTAMAEQIGSVDSVPSLKQALYKASNEIKYVGVEENTGDTEDINGIPAKGIWIILKGAYSNEDVAKAILYYRTEGTPMRVGIADDSSSSSSIADITDFKYTIQRPNDEPFTAYWSNAKEKPIYCKITCFILNEELSTSQVKGLVADSITPEVKETLSTSSIIQILMKEIPNIVITSIEISEDNVTWVSYITPNVDEYIRIPEANITVTEYNQ